MTDSYQMEENESPLRLGPLWLPQLDCRDGWVERRKAQMDERVERWEGIDGSESREMGRRRWMEESTDGKAQMDGRVERWEGVDRWESREMGRR